MEPPKLARWLLLHFGCSPNNEAVIGDLDERYGLGRSGVWYLRQAIVTLIVGFFYELRTHRGVAIKSIIRGWWWVYLSSAAILGFSGIGDYMAGVNHNAVIPRMEPPPLIVQMSEDAWVQWLLSAVSMWAYTLAGFIVARCNREHRVFAVVCFAATVSILAFIGRTSSWLTASSAVLVAQLLILLGGGIFTETATLRHDD